MRKLITFICVAISFYALPQKLYKKISDKNVNQERLNIGKKFALEFLYKCENSEYSKFQDFIIDKRVSKLSDSIEKSCAEINRIEKLKF